MNARSNSGSSPLLLIENQLCFALYTTSRAITKQYSILLKDLGVTYPQYLALLVLWERDGLLVQEIARALELDGATATPILQRMEKLGLVTRKRSAEDERRVQVYLTQKGRSLYDRALEVPYELGRATGLNEQIAKRIIKQMNTIKKHLAAQNRNAAGL
ncbi:MAG: MarR family transcriptional regulator [Pseudomonadota bacterium]